MVRSSSTEEGTVVVQRRRVSRGFTLLELLAVLTIVALLAAAVLGGGRRATELGQIARTKAELAALSAALETYKRVYGDYPRTADAAEVLQALIGRLGPNGERVEGRQLLELANFETADGADPFTNTTARLVDPWNGAYVYVYKSGAPGAWKTTGFVLYSMGPDGAHVAPNPESGYIDGRAERNADNLHANGP